MFPAEVFDWFCTMLSVFISSDAPTFKESLLEISVAVGANVDLSCDADGHPQPNLIWTCNGAHEEETSNHLRIGQIEHNMRCQCTASNYLHNATKEFNIVVVEPSTAVPPAAMTTPDSMPQSGTAHLSFLPFTFHSFYTSNDSD